MTKKRLKQLFLVPLLAVIFYGCYLDVLEVEVSETAGFNIAEARSWFEANVPSKSDRVSLRSGGKPDETDGTLFWCVSRFTPDWQNAVVGTDAYFQIVEVPLQGNIRIVRAGSDVMERAVETEAVCGLITITRLLVRTCRETGARDGFVMIASPDLEYLNRRSDNPMQDFTYLNHGDDFSGLVFFYDLAGEFVTGYKTIDGKFFRFVPQTAADGWTQVCHYECVITRHYWQWYTETESGTRPTGDPIYLFTTTECVLISCSGGGGGGIGDGSGGGTGNGSTEPEEPEQTQADRIFRTSNMTDEDRQILEDLFNETLGNCIGEALVNALTGRLTGTSRLNIQFTDDTVAHFHMATSTITLWRGASSDTFFHEKFHAFQAFGETVETWGNSARNPWLNFEMEARFAQYMFLRNRQQGFAGSRLYELWRLDPSRDEVMRLAYFIDQNGFFLPGMSHRDIIRFDNQIRYTVLPRLYAVPEHRQHNMRYDMSRIGIANFRSLRSLTINC